MKQRRNAVAILSIDGGGIRGLFAIKILQAIQNCLSPSTIPFNEYFQVKAGTSTGSIIAMGLSFKNKTRYALDLDALEDLYVNKGPTIFQRSWFHWLLTLDGLLGAKYSLTNLQQLLSDVFGNQYISDLAGLVYVPTFSDDHGNVVVFDSLKAKHDPELNFYIKDAVIAATAAESYFPPAQIKNKTGQSFRFGDAGIVVNNPEMIALLGAMESYPNANTFGLISIGTGEAKYSFNYQRLKEQGGIIDWLQQGLVSASLDAESKLSNSLIKQLQGILKGKKVEIIPLRFQYIFDQDVVPLDDTSPANLAKIISAADITIRKQYNHIKQAAAFLQKMKAL